MEFVGRLVTTVSEFYKDLNPATLSGAIDVIVVQRHDGTLACSPFHVRFGKMHLLRPTEKIVQVRVNGTLVDGHIVRMKLGEAGEAFFVMDADESVPLELRTSPLAMRPDTTVEERLVGTIEPLDLADGEQALRTHYYNHHNHHPVYTSSDGNSTDTSTGQPMMTPMEELHLATTTPHTLSSTQQHQTAPSEDWNWRWGNLPSKTPLSTALASVDDDDPLLDALLAFIHHGVSNPSSFTTLELISFPSSSPQSTDSSSATEQNAPVHSIVTLDHLLADPWGILSDPRLLVTLPTTSTTTTTTPPPAAAAPAPDSNHVHNTTNTVKVMGRVVLAALMARLMTGTLTKQQLRTLYQNASKPPSTSTLPSQPQQQHPGQSGQSSFSSWRQWWTTAGPAAPSTMTKTTVLATHNASKSTSTTTATVAGTTTTSVPTAAPSVVPASAPASIAATPVIPTSAVASISGANPIDSAQQMTMNDSAMATVTFSPSVPIPMTASTSSTTLPLTSQPLQHASPSSSPPPAKLAGSSFSSTGPPRPSSAPGGFYTAEPGTSPPGASGTTPKFFAKTLRLTSDQLKSLNLRPGPNTVSFSVISSYSGIATCSARIFLWPADVQIVISDIDGTITKSDALGHLFTAIGKDWTHPGIANLYTKIKKNGYEILYLTSRAIGQADSTRGYLKGIEQGNFQLPDGPVIMSPDRLIAALKREVIDRRPEEFKISCLKDIRHLFGDANPSPFYAGFGNRITDAMSYRAVGIPKTRIYSINSKGEVRMDFFDGYTSSYVQLVDLVDHIFPGPSITGVTVVSAGTGVGTGALMSATDAVLTNPTATPTTTITASTAALQGSESTSNLTVIIDPDRRQSTSAASEIMMYWKQPLPEYELPPEILERARRKNRPVSTTEEEEEDDLGSEEEEEDGELDDYEEGEEGEWYA